MVDKRFKTFLDIDHTLPNLFVIWIYSWKDIGSGRHKARTKNSLFAKSLEKSD